jgi:hypothetical protein
MIQAMKYKPLRIRFANVDEESALKFVIGRDGCVSALWDNIRAGSVRVLSERRMGKTWLLQLALARKPEWAVPIYFDAQDMISAPEFVWRLNKEMNEKKFISDDWYGKINKWFDSFRRIFQRLQRQNVGGYTIPEIDPWNSLLSDTFRHFIERSKKGISVLIIDELPFHLDKLMKANAHDDAIQLLDTLRSLRHKFTSLRIVLCGSLGLHIVMRKLREKGYSGQPVNDMPPFEVSPLDPEQSQYLAGCLLLGEKIPCKDIDVIAQSISESSSNVPFYIQHIVKWMRDRKDVQWDEEKVSLISEKWFVSGIDPAEISYYNDRLDEYYPHDIVDKARSVLDVLSSKKEGMDLSEIINLVRHHPKTLTSDTEQISKVIDILRDDHYIIAYDGKWKFKLGIIRKWWWNSRGKYGE